MSVRPPWLSLAHELLGLLETPGVASNPLILQWAQDLGLGKIYTTDGTAWCALFACRMLHGAGLTLPWQSEAHNPYDLLRAASFRTWGVPLTTPAPGAIMVYTRPGGDHVNFYVGERAHDGAIRGLGGNQSDAVTATWIAKTRLTDIRWPADYPLPTTGRVVLASAGVKTSQNEA